MELFTLEQANNLINFYSDKLVGKTIETSTNSIVDYIDKEHYGDNQYRVVAFGKMLPGFIFPKRSINLVAKDLNLPSPQEVLERLNKKSIS